MYRVVLVEDNPADHRALLDLIARIPFLTVVGSFDDPLAALPFLLTEPVDLLLLDLHLPGLSGFGLLRSLPHPPAVILTTSSLASSLEAFDVGVVDYLLKPLRYERFLRAINRALVRQSDTAVPVGESAFIWIKQGHDSIRVAYSDILYVEAFGAYARLHTSTGQLILASHALTELADKLPTSQFIRVHRSFVVALSRITTFSTRQLTLGNTPIPVGRVYQDSVRQVLSQLKQ